jgi:hypothetical protein
MDLEKINFGRVNTYLDELLAGVESALPDRPRELAQALKRANSDPVYRYVATGKFPQPVPDCDSLRRLKQRIERIGRKAGPAYSDLKPFLEAIERFALGYCSAWDEDCYFIVPVMTQTNTTQEPGLVYLHALLKEGNPRMMTGKLDIDDLTRDRRLLSATQDYFGGLVSVLVETLYFAQTYPYDWHDNLAHHSYRLRFGCQITEGRSIGAAALAMFALVYLKSWLGEQFDQVVAPQCGTVLTGEVDRDGRVRPVGNLVEKIECAVEEYGSHLKVIIPSGELLPESLERRIDLGNVCYVSAAEELLAAVLSSRQDSGGLNRGLDQARAALFKKLNPAQKEKLKNYVIEGIDPHVYDRLADGRSSWMTPRSHPGGVYVVSAAGRDRLDFKLSLEPSGLQEDGQVNSGRELVEVVIDGSEAMSDHWVADQKTGICRMTSVLFEIDSNIDPEKQGLVCGFLSHQRFYTISHGTSADKLEDFLQKIRQSEKLIHRGSFFRPVYESSLREYQDRLKRVYVISDITPPDLEDLKDLNLSSLTLLRLFADGHQDTDEAKAVLFPGGEKIDKEALGRYFQRNRGAINWIKIDFGKELPVEWEPQNGVLKNDKDSFVLQFNNVNELKYGVRVRLANRRPREIKISGEISRDGVAVNFSFIEHPTLSDLMPLDLGLSGRLTDEEFEAWLKFDKLEWRCPECGETNLHLLHLPVASAEEKPIFASLRHLSSGYLLLCSDSSDWYFFRNGRQVAGTSFVIIDGKLHWSQARGRVEEVEYENEYYCLRNGSGNYYLCRIT